MRYRNVLKVLDNQARRIAGTTREQWEELSNAERERFRQMAVLEVCGTERLSDTVNRSFWKRAS